MLSMSVHFMLVAIGIINQWNTPPSPDGMPETTMNLVRIITPEEREYTDLTLRIGWRTDQIAALEAELKPIQRAFEAFEWEYTQRVGHLANELREARSTAARVEHQTARIHARLVSDPSGVLGDLFDRDELLEIGEMFGIEVPDDWFASARESSRSGGDDWDWAGQFAGEEEILRNLNRNSQRALPKDVATELRTRYRALARQFHPDLAENDDERALRQEIMLRINHAWHCQDVDALREIEQELEHMLPGWSANHLAHRLAWARRECERLETQANALLGRIRQLRASETFPLWFNNSLGRTVINQRVAALRRELGREQERLETAKIAFKHALAHYAAAIA